MPPPTAVTSGRRARTAIVAAGLAAVGVALVASARPASPAIHARRPDVPQPIVLNDNGAWSWFQDERAVIDEAAGVLLVSSVADAAGTDGAVRDGNVEVASLDLDTGAVQRTVLHPGLEADDHNAAALYVRPDGRYVAMYARHLTDDVTRWRVTQRPGDATTWHAERTVGHRGNVTYANIYTAETSDDRPVLHSFVRSVGSDPNILASTDHGSSWRSAGRLLDGVGRPYPRFAAAGDGRIHLVTTEQHPHDFANGVYHGVIDHGQLRRSDGTVVDADLSDGIAVRPERLSVVHPSGNGHAWTIDLHVDRAGHPYAAFSVRGSPAPVDGERACAGSCYYYARFDGSAWRVHHLADAGNPLSPRQPHYAGLVALHPHDPNRVFISTDVDPTTGAPLVSTSDGRRHHEIFAGHTSDAGATWTWNAVTVDSSADNIRPIVPVWDDRHTALLWLRGTYRGYQDYDLDVVATFPDGP